MAYSVRIERDSISPDGVRLMTAVWTFPRIVLAEVLTHRKLGQQSDMEFEVVSPERTAFLNLSKSSASSRAIPVEKMIAAVMDDPYIPTRFSKTGKGMQESGWLEGADAERARSVWLNARDSAVDHARALLDLGVHKQDANRLLEPFAWVTQVITGDQYGWANFFALRTDAMAHPAFRKIARMLYMEYRKSKSTELYYGQWHLPFVSPIDQMSFNWHPPSGLRIELPDIIKFSAARCGWVSYANHNKDGTSEQMLRTFQRFVGQLPIHAAPVEHQACPSTSVRRDNVIVPEWRSNLEGWIQARKLLHLECIREFNASDETIASWSDDLQ